MPSLPTLRAIMRDHPLFPVIEAGRRGRPFRLDLDAAASFVRRVQAEHTGTAEERERWCRDQGLCFAGRADA